MNDTTDNPLWREPGGDTRCEYCDEWFGSHDMKTSYEGKDICLECRIMCDYCQEYFPFNEIHRVVDGKSCIGCIVDNGFDEIIEVREIWDDIFEKLAVINEPPISNPELCE